MNPSDPFAPEKRPLSVSQLKQYERCPYSYYLSRIEKAWQRPAAWLAQGTAVHAAIEGWERSGRSMSLEDAQAVFRESYVEEANKACELTPNFEWWFASGPYGGEQDLVRRFQIGLEQVEKYLDWATSHPEEAIKFTDDGEPAIELAFDIELDNLRVRGYIDAVVLVETSPGVWELRVRDHKTGNNPGDDFQLGVYSVALEEIFGVKPEVGDYWMGRSGKPTYPFDLSDWTREAVTEKFRELQANIDAGRFDPDPEPSKCRFCDVSYGCEYVAG
jgi:putative RecB family exonuclease